MSSVDLAREYAERLADVAKEWPADTEALARAFIHAGALLLAEQYGTATVASWLIDVAVRLKPGEA